MLAAQIGRKVEKEKVGVIVERDRGLRLVRVQRSEVRDVKPKHRRVSDVKPKDRLMKREIDRRLGTDLGRNDRALADRMMSSRDSWKNCKGSEPEELKDQKPAHKLGRNKFQNSQPKIRLRTEARIQVVEYRQDSLQVTLVQEV